jgi:hypothetical protein
LHAFALSSTPCPDQLTLFELITLLTYVENVYKLWTSSLCSFLHSRVISPPHSSHHPISNGFCSDDVRYRASILCSLIFTFLVTRLGNSLNKYEGSRDMNNSTKKSLGRVPQTVTALCALLLVLYKFIWC